MTPLPPKVAVDRRGEAAGMAQMVADLVEANLADSPRRARAARNGRGEVVLLATDRHLGVTVRFTGEEVVVSGEADPAAQTRLAGSWLDMAEVCSGRRSALVAVAGRRIRILKGGRLRVLVRAAFVLKAPSSAYATAGRWRRKGRTSAAREAR